MMHFGAARALALLLATLMTAPPAFCQAPQLPQNPTATPPKPAAPSTPATPAAQSIAPPLTIAVLEGSNSINSISLGRSVTPVVEVRDQNEFPVEGATVIFTLPATGPGGSFPGNQSMFTTRSDAHGQASAPFIVNGLPGKFQIHVKATLGERTGETTITQTNSMGEFIGTAAPKPHFYKKWYVWALVGGAAVGAVIAFTRGSSSAPEITITPGGPVFGGPH